MKILITAAGTTDPVRNCYDGPIMHIMRYYRPDVVYLMMTNEIARLNEDNRFGLMLEQAKTWDGYDPKVIFKKIPTDDPSDLDSVNDYIANICREIGEIYQKDEILVNISSGTPQIKICLSFIASDIRNNYRAVQVKNPEKSSGKSERTNSKNFSPADEIPLADEMEISEGINRCSESKLITFRRNTAKHEILALLKSRDYNALKSKFDVLNPEIKDLINHLAARNNLEAGASEYAEKLKNKNFKIDLYPRKKIRYDRYQKDLPYEEIVEYFLVMKNMVNSGRYSDFLLRLNPFSLELSEKAIDVGMRKKYGKHVNEIFTSDLNTRKKVIDREKLKKEYPELFNVYTNSSKYIIEDDRERNPHIYHAVLSAFDNELSGDVTVTLEKCYNLYNSRNIIAHQLKSVTAEDIKNIINISTSELIERIGRTIEELYPCCDPEIFSIYERCNRYIEDSL